MDRIAERNRVAMSIRDLRRLFARCIAFGFRRELYGIFDLLIEVLCAKRALEVHFGRRRPIRRCKEVTEINGAAFYRTGIDIRDVHRDNARVIDSCRAARYKDHIKTRSYVSGIAAVMPLCQGKGVLRLSGFRHGICAALYRAGRLRELVFRNDIVAVIILVVRVRILYLAFCLISNRGDRGICRIDLYILYELLVLIVAGNQLIRPYGYIVICNARDCDRTLGNTGLVLHAGCSSYRCGSCRNYRKGNTDIPCRHHRCREDSAGFPV